MPPLPPLKFALQAVQNDVLPAAGAGALVLCLFLALGRWAAALGSAVAVAVAVVAGNFTFDKLKPTDKPTWANTDRLVPFVPEGNPAGWNWLPRAALVLLVVGLLSRWAGLAVGRSLPDRRWWVANVIVWVPRIVAVVVVSGWLVEGPAAAGWHWLQFNLALVMIVTWATLDTFARSSPAVGVEVALYQAAIFLTAGVVFLYAHFAKMTDLATILGCALFGIAAAAWIGRADTSGAIPATVAFLPGIVLGTRPSLPDNNLPAACFWLVALAPLVLAPFLIPALARKTGWRWPAIRAGLVLILLLTVVLLAGKYEVVAYDEGY